MWGEEEEQKGREGEEQEEQEEEKQSVCDSSRLSSLRLRCLHVLVPGDQQ